VHRPISTLGQPVAGSERGVSRSHTKIAMSSSVAASVRGNEMDTVGGLVERFTCGKCLFRPAFDLNPHSPFDDITDYGTRMSMRTRRFTRRVGHLHN
jgi:hypothetical protein